jgi:hypothetical protein
MCLLYTYMFYYNRKCFYLTFVGQLKYGRAAIKWATDYFIKCHVSPYEFYGQVGDFNLDHTYWGRPEELNMTRPSYKIDAQHPGKSLLFLTYNHFIFILD